MVKLLVVLLLTPGCIAAGTGWGYDTSARHQLVINEQEQALTELHEELEAASENDYSLFLTNYGEY